MDPEQFSQFLALQQQFFQQLLSNQNRQNQDGPRVIPQQIISNFENFDVKAETFLNYKKRFENYISLKGIDSNSPFCAKVLLNSIGAKTFETVSALEAPKQLTALSYADLLETLEKHLSPQRNFLVAQHQFLNRFQSAEQSIAEYVASLRADVTECKFQLCECETSSTDVFLRAQFIRGIRSNCIREQLLQSKTENCSFKEIVEKAIALEAAKSDAKTLEQPTSAAAVIDIHQIRGRGKQKPYRSASSQRSSSRHHNKSRVDYRKLGIDGLCLRCGRDNHTSSNCRVDQRKLKCQACNKTGHIVKVCISSLMKNEKSSTNNESNDVNGVSCDYGVLNVKSNNQCNLVSDRFVALIRIEDQEVEFEVDTGSAFTFLPISKFHALKLKTIMRPTNMTFRAYTQTPFKPEGKITVKINYNGVNIEDDIFIVSDKFSALVGRTWIRRLAILVPRLEDSSLVQHIYNEEETFAKYADLFDNKIGCVPSFEVNLKLRPNATPVYCREREIPHALKERVEDELNRLENDGIITKVETSDWGSPLVVIPKQNNEVRLCVDYKVAVNERLTGAHYPIKKIDEILNNLRNSRYFCRLDLYKAYLHLRVDEKSSEIQSISTHRGTYRMNRLSFGIKTAPAEFNRIMDQILRGVPKTENYFDDIIVHGSTREEAQINLTNCLQQLRKYDLHLNKGKCSLYQTKIEFLGHIIEFNAISKSPQKIEAVTNMPRPKTVEDVRTFLGMVTYYSRFIPKASTITAPLRALLKKNFIFRWTSQCEAAFLKLKSEIASDRILVPFDPTLPVILACDASPYGVSGVLSHFVNNEERPVAFASRSLSDAEKNYSQLDREALAIVFSVDRFYQYLFGRKFTLITDNQPLVHIFKENSKIPRMSSARLQRYAAFLSGFNYKVQFKKGIDNSNADCLSRAPISMKSQRDAAINLEVNHICRQTVFSISSLKLTYSTLVKETAQDNDLSKIIQNLQKNCDPEPNFTIESQLLFRGPRIVIPASLQSAVLDELHRTHIGVTKMKQLARRYVYWVNIDKDIERLVRSCDPCASVRNNPPKAPLHHWEEPEGNWERVHIDYAGPFRGFNFLVVIDAKSKWIEIKPIHTAPTSSSTIEMLKEIFANHGFPSCLVSDNATLFTSGEFQEFCHESGIFQKFSAPGHPETNGLAERTVQILKKRLNAMCDEPGSISEKLREVLFHYRATPLKCGKSPAEFYLQRQLRIKLDALRPAKFIKTKECSPRSRQLSVGDTVQSKFYSKNSKTTWKLGKIVQKLGQLHYMVKLDNSYVLKRHIDQLRLASKPHKSVTFQEEVEIAKESSGKDTIKEYFYLPVTTTEVPIPPAIPESTPSKASSGLDTAIRRAHRKTKVPSHLRDYELSF